MDGQEGLRTKSVIGVRHGALSPCAAVRASETAFRNPAPFGCGVHLQLRLNQSHYDVVRSYGEIKTWSKETKKECLNLMCRPERFMYAAVTPDSYECQSSLRAS